MTNDDPWEPIATAPADVHYIEGSDNGQQFSKFYSRVMIGDKAYWQERRDFIGEAPLTEGPKFWRRMRDFHGRDVSVRTVHSERS